MPNVIYTPPKEIFEFQTETVAEKLNVGGLSHILNGIEVITNKGIFCSFEGVKYPKKGFPFPDAVHAINQVKRQTMMLVLPIARKEMVLPMSTLLLIGHKRRIKLLQNFLEHYNRNMEYIIHNVYVKREFMTPCAREIRNFIEVFLINLGITQDVSELTAKIFSHLIEYDDAYRYRIQDIFTVLDKERFIKNPRTEIDLMMLKMSERELNQKDVLPKFKAFAKIIYLALFQSDIRKAFNKAIESIDFDNLRMDEADKYHCLIRVDYDFDGRTSEDRMKEYSQIHKDGYPPLV